jgi:RNA polymerase sigma factor (sigma-70 family)
METMSDDSQLLQRFAADRSEAAFGELVARHVALVYSAALRQTNGDIHLAKDIAQLVFADLARKAPALSEKIMLAGWLHRATIFAARQILRSERRRCAREQQAVTMNMIQSETGNDQWEQIRPLLDEALERLNKTDRDALLLRFFENQSLAQVGANLGGSEDAARKRVNRALEKLRAFFARRGVATTATALATVISANAIQIAPAGLAATLTTSSIAVAATGTTLTFLKIMTATKIKLGIGALIVAGATTAFIVQHQAEMKLRGQNESLTRQIAQLQTENENLSKPAPQVQRMPQLPAPQMQMAASVVPSPTADSPSTNFYSQLKDKPSKLTSKQIEAYLKANGRSAANLLAAFRTSGDPALLQEAMQKYPNDPQVDFEAVLEKNLSPDEQRQWLNTFEKSAPDNALANYLSALNYFNSGQIDQGVQELSAASGKQFNDYTLSRYQDDEEAYLAAGYSQADAEAIASMQETVPQLAQLKQLGLDTVDLANAYSQAGDTASAQAALQMAANLGRSYANPTTGTTGEPAISQLVGMAIESIAFNAMDPNSPYGGNGQTVQDQLNQLAQQKAAIQQLFQQADPLRQTMSDQDWIIYTDRRMIFGEVAAAQWIVSKYGQQ